MNSMPVRRLAAICTAFPLLLLLALPLRAADRDRLESFLNVTGFDVALESIRLSAESAPEMLGLAAEDFGTEWTRLVASVFRTATMHDLALDMLSETLSDAQLAHAVDFYSSDLGQRLVAVENASSMTEDEGLKDESGAAIVEGLQGLDSPRLDYLRRMIRATDSAGTTIRALQEIQVRFLMAAAAAGVIELQMDEADLRELFAADEAEMRKSLAESALAHSAYTYQAFSDAEVLAYAEALEHPDMRAVYDLLNAVQYEVMANRFEALAQAMANLQPSQEL